MNTSQPTPLVTGFLSDDPLERSHLGYLHARIQNKAHDCVLQVFLDEAEARKINKAYIARRLRKRPEVVGRWLAAPGNYELNTIAELLGSMGYEVEFYARPLHAPLRPNQIHDWMVAEPPIHTNASAAPSVIKLNAATPVSDGVGSGNVRIGTT